MTGKSVARRRQTFQIEADRIELSPLQVNFKYLPAHLVLGQIDEKYLIEAALAQQFGRQSLDIVRGRDQDGDAR